MYVFSISYLCTVSCVLYTIKESLVTFVKVKSYFVRPLSWFCHPLMFSKYLFCCLCDVSVMLWCHSHIVIFVGLFCCVKVVISLESGLLNLHISIFLMLYICNPPIEILIWEPMKCWNSYLRIPLTKQRNSHLRIPLKFLFENPLEEILEPPPGFWSCCGHLALRFEALQLWGENHHITIFFLISLLEHVDIICPSKSQSSITRQCSPVEEGVVPVWFSRSSKTASVASLIFSAASSMLVSTPCWQIFQPILSQQSCSAHAHYTCLREALI